MKALTQQLAQYRQLYQNEVAYCRSLEIKYSQLEGQLRDLAQERTAAQNRVHNLEGDQEKVVCTALAEMAQKLAERSKAYFSLPSDLRQEKLATSDQRIIKVYEDNRDEPLIQQTLQQAYQQASQRQQLREQQQKTLEERIEAGVVISRKDEPGEQTRLYVSVLAAQQSERLMANLMEVVATVLVVTDGAKIQQHEEKEGILVIDVPGASEEALIEALRKEQPEEFSSANIDYSVVSLDKMLAATPDKPLITLPAPKEEKEKAEIRKYAVQEILSTRDYIPIRDVAALTGYHSSSFYRFIDFKGGPLKSRQEGQTRLVEITSLLEIVEQRQGPVRLYALEDVTVLWKQKTKRELDSDVELATCQKQLQKMHQQGEIYTLKGEDGREYLCEQEFNRIAVNYFARKKMEQWKSSSISRSTLSKLLQIRKGYIASLVRAKKLDYAEPYKSLTVDSVKQFLEDHYFDRQHWLSIKQKEGEKE